MENIFCPRCHKKTKYLYRLNDGIYCDHDYEAGLIRQDMKMRMEDLKKLYFWDNKIITELQIK